MSTIFYEFLSVYLKSYLQNRLAFEGALKKSIFIKK